MHYSPGADTGLVRLIRSTLAIKRLPLSCARRGKVSYRSFSQTDDRFPPFIRLRLVAVQIAKRFATIFADGARPSAAVWPARDVRGHVFPVAAALDRTEEDAVGGGD